MINYWIKTIQASDIGKAKTHEAGYVNLPTKRKTRTGGYIGKHSSPATFYGKEPGLPTNHVYITHIDKKTGETYDFRYELAKSSGGGQIRLYELKDLVNARSPDVGDEIIVEKMEHDGVTEFIVDIIHQGSPKLLPISKKIKKVKKKPEFNPASNYFRDGRHFSKIKKDKIIKEAEIYKTTLTIDKKKYTYVGQDSACAGTEHYFGSSLVIYHYRQVFGDEIIQKEIITTLKDIKQTDLNDIEWKYIEEDRKNAKKNGWHNINYTGRK